MNSTKQSFTPGPWKSTEVYQSLSENSQKEYHIETLDKKIQIGVIYRREDAEFIVNLVNAKGN